MSNSAPTLLGKYSPPTIMRTIVRVVPLLFVVLVLALAIRIFAQFGQLMLLDIVLQLTVSVGVCGLGYLLSAMLSRPEVSVYSTGISIDAKTFIWDEIETARFRRTTNNGVASYEWRIEAAGKQFRFRSREGEGYIDPSTLNNALANNVSGFRDDRGFNSRSMPV